MLSEVESPFHIHRRYTKLHSHLWERYSEAAAEAAAAAGGAAQRLPTPPELSLVHDCSVAQLLQPDMTADAVQVGGCCASSGPYFCVSI
jgi:hypothetical protein